MGRKNVNAIKSGRRKKLPISKGHHFMYSTDEFGEDATVVRYLGEQDDNLLLCQHPEGFRMWIHLHHLWNPAKRAA